ncbi:Hemicentin-1 [Holothuria leucospilota]|uniref:Hemicentin-1 n=1 Tax=Holothuria leucospilota TaxID=206669 RepID=A0A9Q1C905_HOLLE|nr:Hemicentin-1 [Holothuria leucospilota]
MCNSFSCPIDGGFSEWTDWEPCSKTCGGGQTMRTRTCTAPSPQHGGLPCYGSYSERKLCAAFYCPVHGGWSNWGPWSECPVTCQGAIVNRTRTCTNPSPKHDGQHCEGPLEDWMICAADPCPVDGFWSAWSPWSACSVSCGEGLQVARRGCEDPPPQHGGSECPEEVPVPSNITASVHLTEDTMTVMVYWDLVPAESHVDYIVFQVKTPTRFGSSTNTSTRDWVTYGYVPQGVSSLPLRDDEGAGLFTTVFDVRLLARSEFGERMSGEKSFNVAAYIPTGISSHHLKPSNLWISLGVLLVLSWCHIN